MRWILGTGGTNLLCISWWNGGYSTTIEREKTPSFITLHPSSFVFRKFSHFLNFSVESKEKSIAEWSNVLRLKRREYPCQNKPYWFSLLIFEQNYRRKAPFVRRFARVFHDLKSSTMAMFINKKCGSHSDSHLKTAHLFEWSYISYRIVFQ